MVVEEGGRVDQFKMTKHEERAAWNKAQEEGTQSGAGNGANTQRTGSYLPSTIGTC